MTFSFVIAIMILLYSPPAQTLYKPPKPSVRTWIGWAPFCAASYRNCHSLGLRFLQANATGHGRKCLIGKKVLCEPHDIEHEAKLKFNSKTVNTSELLLAAYNIYDRPFFVSHDGQRERLCRIPKALIDKEPNLDVIVFSEAFTGICWSDITFKKLLSYYGFSYFTATVGKGSETKHQRKRRRKRFIGLLNGGVFIASKWPILNERSHVYRAFTYTEADALSKKGVVYAQINKAGRIYHILGTHLQAQVGRKNEITRIAQAAELLSFLSSLKVPRIEPVIVAGDFNCDWISNKVHSIKVFKAMGVIEPPLSREELQHRKTDSKLAATYETSTNDMVYSAGWQGMMKWLDYALPVKGYLQPTQHIMTPTRLKVKRPVRYCSSAPLQPHFVFSYSSFCRKVAVTRDLSDHHPIFSKFSYPKVLKNN